MLLFWNRVHITYSKKNNIYMYIIMFKQCLTISLSIHYYSKYTVSDLTFLLKEKEKVILFS